MHNTHLLFATKGNFTENKNLIIAQYWGASLNSHYRPRILCFSKVLHTWLLKMTKSTESWYLHSYKNSTFFPLQLWNVKYNQQQQREECFTHWAAMWHLQNLSIHPMLHSFILHLLRLEGKIFLCYCSVQLLEAGNWNAWDLQKLACQQLCWRKYPEPRQFSRGCSLNSPTPSNSLEPGTQMAPTNHLRLMICQYVQDHKKKNAIFLFLLPN